MALHVIARKIKSNSSNAQMCTREISLFQIKINRLELAPVLGRKGVNWSMGPLSPPSFVGSEKRLDPLPSTVSAEGAHGGQVFSPLH